MPDVSKIKLPDNTVLNIKDCRIPGVDTEPTSGSDNVVTSGGVYDKINDESLVISTALNDLNNRLLDVEEKTLQIDETPTEDSTNLVTSGGVYAAIIENEIATASALNDLNERVDNVDDIVGDGSDFVKVPDYEDDQEVVVRGINDLNDRIETIEGDYVTTEPFYEIESTVRDTYTKQEVDDLFSTYEPQITETDPVFSASPAANITASDITNWNNKTSNTGTVTQVNVGSTSYNPSSGVVSLPEYPTVTDTKNTAGSTDTSNKIFLIGATSQAANPQTYSNENVYEQNGELTASKFNGPLETSYTDTTNNLSMYKSIGLNKKVYTGVLGVTNGSSPNNNTYANQSVYFLTIHPTSWDAEWSIKYKLNIHLDNESQIYKSSSTASNVSAGVYTRGIYDCNLTGTAGIYSTFHMFQSQKNTSYRPIYYHMFHSTTSAGYTAGNGHKIGVCFYSSYLPTPVTDYSSGSAVANTKYTRTIEVIVEEAVNCTFELANTLEVEGDAYRSDYTKLNTTYYTTNASSSNSAGRWINLSATTQGLYESGDDNTYTYTQQSSNYMKNTTKSGDTGVKLWSYPLIGFDKDGNAMGISVYSGSQSSNTTGISAKGTRLYCTEGFDYTKGIRYVSTSSSFNYNADMNVSTQINYSGVDFRYTDNCVPSATANNLGLVNRKPVYLRGTIGNDGLFYLAPIDVTYNNGTYQRAWVQDVPSVENEDGEYVYWFIGHPYYNSSYAAALYQLNLITQGELVWYKDGNVRPYITPQSITETDPVFSASAAAGITSSDITNWNSKTSNTGTLTGVKFNNVNATVSNGVASISATIPAAVTESTVSGWGFTKNTGTYSKPSGGIPATDLASAVQTSLGKADTALQSFTETDPTVPSWAKQSTKPTYTASEVGALPDTTVIPSAPGTLKTNATTAQTASSGEAMSGTITLHKVAKTGTYSDLIGTPTIPTKVSDLTNDSGFTSNAGTITGITMNGASKGTSGVVNLGTVLTSETALSKGTTTGSGNAVTDISVSGHQITLTKDSTFLTSETSLSKGTTTGSGNAVTDISVSGHQITLTKGTTFLTSHQDISGKANLSGAAFTGTVTGTPSGNTGQFRNITISSSEPTASDGSNGDIWIVI